MSGGYFSFDNYKIDEVAERVERLLHAALNGHYDDDDQYSSWEKKLIANAPAELKSTFNDAVICLKKAAVYAHRIDWLLSGDDGEESFLKRLKDQLNEIDKGKN